MIVPLDNQLLHILQVSPYVAEFWNTISNVVMIVAALRGFYDVHTQGFEKRYSICIDDVDDAKWLLTMRFFQVSLLFCIFARCRSWVVVFPHDAQVRNAAPWRAAHGVGRMHPRLLHVSSANSSQRREQTPGILSDLDISLLHLLPHLLQATDGALRTWKKKT